MSAAATALAAEDIIRRLNLAPHPEGGWYRETFRDPRLLADGRAASTAIYFLLAAGQVSRWHRVDAAEVWHWYGGSALELSLAFNASAVPDRLRLGPDLDIGDAPQIVVPAGHWQQARTLGTWTLCGCTVAPGFTFAGFEMATDGFEPGAST